MKVIYQGAALGLATALSLSACSAAPEQMTNSESSTTQMPGGGNENPASPDDSVAEMFDLPLGQCFLEATTTGSAVSVVGKGTIHIAYGFEYREEKTNEKGVRGTEVLRDPQVVDCPMPDGRLDKIFMTAAAGGEGDDKFGIMTGMVVIEFLPDGTYGILTQPEGDAAIAADPDAGVFVNGVIPKDYLGQEFIPRFADTVTAGDPDSITHDTYAITVDVPGGGSQAVMTNIFYPHQTIDEIGKPQTA